MADSILQEYIKHRYYTYIGNIEEFYDFTKEVLLNLKDEINTFLINNHITDIKFVNFKDDIGDCVFALQRKNVLVMVCLEVSNSKLVIKIYSYIKEGLGIDNLHEINRRAISDKTSLDITILKWVVDVIFYLISGGGM